MKYADMKKEAIAKLNNDLVENKELYNSGETDENLYNLSIMKKTIIQDMAFGIQSNHEFKEICKTINEMKEELKKYQVSKVDETIFEEEDGWGGFYYFISEYTPFDSLNQVEYLDDIIENKIIEIYFPEYKYKTICGFPYDVFNIFKKDLMTYEAVLKVLRD